MDSNFRFRGNRCPPEGQAIDRSDLGCGQPLELADLGIDPRR
jgi:hypothetical protein